MLRENEPTQSRPDDGEDTSADRSGSPVADSVSAFDGPGRADAEPATLEDEQLAQFKEDLEDEDDGVREMDAKVHRVPRMGSFMALGAIVGVVVVTILTFAFPPTEAFTRIQVFAFLLAFTVPVTLALGGLAGYFAGRGAAKKSVDARLIRADELENRG